MVYTVLTLLFLAVFGAIAWRVLMGYRLRGEASAQPSASYECPVCNETECDCHKKE